MMGTLILRFKKKLKIALEIFLFQCRNASLGTAIFIPVQLKELAIQEKCLFC